MELFGLGDSLQQEKRHFPLGFVLSLVLMTKDNKKAPFIWPNNSQLSHTVVAHLLSKHIV